MTTFRFPCYRVLIKTLGKLDAVVEFAELSTREVLSQCDDDRARREYIKTLSRKHGVIVDDVDAALLPVRMSQLYVLSAYQQAEEFLQQFRNQHPDSKTWKYGEIEESDLFKRITSNLAQNYLAATEKIGKIECQIYDLYRLARNRFMHSGVNEQRINNLADKIRMEIAVHDDFKNLDSPNHFHEMTFDDFILFTRAIKRIAKAMCQIGRPTDSQIATMLIASRTPTELSKIRKVKNNSHRLNSKLKTILLIEYCLNSEESDSIVSELVRGPLA